MIFSHSSLEAAADCPLQGWMSATTKRVEKAGPSRQGTAFHRICEAYTRHLWTKKVPCDVEAGQRIVRRTLVHLSEVDAKGVHRDAMRFVEDDFDWLLEATEEPEWEERIHLTLDGRVVPVDKIGRVGTIYAYTRDLSWRVGETLHVLDWKSGRVKEHTSEPSENRQLLRYMAAEANRTDAEEFVPHIYHVRYGDMDTGTRVHGRDELAEVWMDLVIHPINVRTSVQSGAMPSGTLGDHCQLCDFRARCADYQTMPLDPPMVENWPTPEGFRVAALEYASILNTKAKDANRLLKWQVGQYGAIEGRTHTADVNDESTWSYDLQKTAAYLSELIPAENIANGLVLAAGEHVDDVNCAFTVTTSAIDGAMASAGMSPKERREKIEEMQTLFGERKLKTVVRIRQKKKRKRKLDAGDDDELPF